MIEVSIKDFVRPPLQALNGQVVARQVSPLDIALGAATIRRQAAPGLRLRSWVDRGATALQIMSALDGGGPLGLNGALPIQAVALEFLDPSEKGNLSYRVGMGIAHVLAKELLGAFEVGHVDAAMKAGLVKLVSGEKHPDLVALDRPAKDVLVIEAKGRSNGGVSSAIALAKTQTRNVAAAGTKPTNVSSPVYRIASVADLSQPALIAHFVDPPDDSDDAESGESPPEPEPEPTQLVVEPVAFARSYYSAVAELAEVSGGLTADVPGLPAGLPVHGAQLPGTRIWLALADSVSRAAKGSDRGLISRIRRAQRTWQDEHVMRLRSDEQSTQGGNGYADAGRPPWTSLGLDGFLLHIEPDAFQPSRAERRPR